MDVHHYRHKEGMLKGSIELVGIDGYAYKVM